MLRITRTKRDGKTYVLKIEGRIAGPWARHLKQECRRLIDEGYAVQLDLSHVKFVGPRGVAALRSLIKHEIEICGASPILHELLADDRSS